MKIYFTKRCEVWYCLIKYTLSDGTQRTKRCSTRLRGPRKPGQDVLKHYLDEYSYLERCPQSDQMLVSDYLAGWKQKQENKVAKSTYEAYYSYFDCHMIPYFADKKIELHDLRAKHIQEFVNYLQNQGQLHKTGGLSANSVRKILFLLRKAMDDAVIEDLILYNPAISVKVQRLKEEKGQDKNPATSITEAQEIIKSFEGHYLYPLVLITMVYGLRREEVLGLRWRAVDLYNDTITINHTVCKNRTIIESDSTKTDTSHAVFPILPEVKKIFLDLQEKEGNYKQMYGSKYIQNDYIFKSENGKPYRPDSVTKTFRNHLFKSCGRKMRFHDLRGSTASIMANEGFTQIDTQTWLRHKDYETTKNVYVQVSKNKVIGVSEKLNGYFERLTK